MRKFSLIGIILILLCFIAWQWFNSSSLAASPSSGPAMQALKQYDDLGKEAQRLASNGEHIKAAFAYLQLDAVAHFLNVDTERGDEPTVAEKAALMQYRIGGGGDELKLLIQKKYPNWTAK